MNTSTENNLGTHAFTVYFTQYAECLLLDIVKFVTLNVVQLLPTQFSLVSYAATHAPRYKGYLHQLLKCVKVFCIVLIFEMHPSTSNCSPVYVDNLVVVCR